MPDSYRWAVEYDRNRPSRVNPPEDDFEAALADEMHEVFDRGCANCGEPNVDGVCVLCYSGDDDYRHVLEPESF